ncbi:hypothetical protein, partial [Candidatus Ichthyocystis hellenicum]|uniref:hypothetical protein n=1 Tax=Candidatus Ichthyocystis hellenicum TaxID=1561003 RepID=UPI00111219C5
MSGIRDSAQCVGAAGDLLSEECDHTITLRQEEVGNPDDLPSCSNDDTGSQGLTSDCNELSGVEGVAGDVDQCPSRIEMIIPVLESGVREIEDSLGVSRGENYYEDVCRIRKALCTLREMASGVDVVVTTSCGDDSAGYMSMILGMDGVIALLEEGTILVESAIADFTAVDYQAKVRWLLYLLKDTLVSEFVTELVGIKGDLRVFRVQKEQMSFSRKCVVGNSESGGVDVVGDTPNLEKIIEDVVGDCNGNVEFSTLLKDLIGGFLAKITASNEVVAGIDVDPDREGLVNLVLRVAANV